MCRTLDEKRILWAAGDIVENRPPLSRWHPDWAEKFKKWVDGKLPVGFPTLLAVLPLARRIVAFEVFSLRT